MYNRNTNLKEISTLDLTMRLNHIMVEEQDLALEWNRIVDELWARLPNLKNDTDITHKSLVKQRKLPPK